MNAELIAAMERALGSRWLSPDHEWNRTKEACDIRLQMCVALDRARLATKPLITITVEGGVVQDVDIPEGLNVDYEIVDYDNLDAEEEAERSNAAHAATKEG